MKDFKKVYRNIFQLNWQFGLVLILIFGIPRFVLVLQANQTGNYSTASIIFVLMAITPFILLSKGGRVKIGIKKPVNYLWLIYSFGLGILGGIILFVLGKLLYDYSISNWLVYISRSYTLPPEALKESNKPIYFVIFAIVGMTFSPIGEEFLYRGLIHQSFVPKFGENAASYIDSLAFALVHLAHFGIVFSDGKWQFLFIPALIWMLLMIIVSRLFFICKINTGSIFGAVICHAAFNLAMTYFIFYFILL